MTTELLPADRALACCDALEALGRSTWPCPQDDAGRLLDACHKIFLPMVACVRALTKDCIWGYGPDGDHAVWCDLALGDGNRCDCGAAPIRAFVEACEAAGIGVQR